MTWRALALISALAWTAPALATDDTDDTDVSDTDVYTGGGSSENTAVELSGEEGGLDCSSAGAASIPALALLGVLAVTRRRRIR